MWRVLVAVLALAAAAGCSPALNQTRAIEDAQLAVRVKTAIVNDATLGVRPITVTAVRGIVQLAGRVASDSEAVQAVTLARSVAGVVDVRSALLVGDVEAADSDSDAADPADSPPLPEVYELDEDDSNVLAVGGSLTLSSPTNNGLDSHVKVGPMVRLGAGRGLAPAIGFSWYNADLLSRDSGPMGRLRVRPVMGGLAYSVRRNQLTVTFSAVGGPAFNSLSGQGQSAGPDFAIDVTNSVAVRAGASFWLETSEATAVNVFTGYLLTRPDLTVLRDGDLVTERLRADTMLLSLGLVYRLF